MKRWLPAVAGFVMVLMSAAPGASGQESEKDPKKDPDQIGSRDVGKGVNFYSIEKEMALGKVLAKQFEQESRMVNNPRITEYVNRIGQNLVRNSDARMPLTVMVVESDVVNAMSLPGGYLFVNTGLILNTDNEAELAGAMAHEVGHVAARHSTRQATRGEIANLATIPLIFMGGWPGYGARQAASLAVPAELLKFSRGFEAEADLLGLEYMYKAGYDPAAFVDVFEKLETLEKRKPGTMARLFATHPLTDDRLRSAQKNIQQNLKAKTEYVLNTSEFDSIKDELTAMRNRRQVHRDAPQLRKGPGADPSIVDGADPKKPKSDEDDRPALKRRLAAAD